TTEESPPPASRAERLRSKAARAHEAQSAAEARPDKQIAAGRSSEARNSETVAGLRASRAAEFSEEARREELHSVALAQAQATLVADCVRGVLGAVGVEATGPVAEVIVHQLGGTAAGEV